MTATSAMAVQRVNLDLVVAELRSCFSPVCTDNRYVGQPLRASFRLTFPQLCSNVIFLDFFAANNYQMPCIQKRHLPWPQESPHPFQNGNVNHSPART